MFLQKKISLRFRKNRLKPIFPKRCENLEIIKKENWFLGLKRDLFKKNLYSNLSAKALVDDTH